MSVVWKTNTELCRNINHRSTELALLPPDYSPAAFKNLLLLSRLIFIYRALPSAYLLGVNFVDAREYGFSLFSKNIAFLTFDLLAAGCL